MKALRKLAALVLAGALCMSVFTGCGINPDETAATLGEETVSLGLVNFMAKYQKASMDDMYALYASYYGVKDLWNVDLYGSGSTTKENLVTSVMSYFHDLYTLKAHMSDYNVTLSSEDEQKIKEAATTFMTSNSEAAIKEFGATQELVEELLTLYTIEYYMYEAITADTDREVSDEEANMRGFSYIEVGIDGYYDSSYNYVEYTDEEIEDITKKVNKIVESLGESTLEEVAEEYDYDVTEAAYSTYEDDEDIDEDLLKALKELKEGETSGLIKGEKYIYVARIDADTDKEATEDNRDAIIASRESELYGDVLEGWQKDDGWTVNKSAVAKIEFHHVFTQDDGSTETESDSSTESESETSSETETTTEK